jgi:peptidyl-prolyl cis-trans isomerase D
MLNSLRQYATGWVAQVLLGILVISFAVWGVADIFTGFRANDIARVGSTDITIADFSRDYDSAVQNYSRQFGSALTPAQARQIGIPSQVLGRLVNQALLDNAAGKMGLGLSDAELGKLVASDPDFFGPSGTFDRSQLNAVIRQQGYTEDAFILARRQETVRAQLAGAIAGGVTSPVSYLKALHTYRTEERDLSYVLLTAPAATDIPEPGDTDLNAFYELHKKDYDAPEVRAVDYFVLSAASLAKVDDISDDDAKKEYDAHPERWTTEETRHLEQIVFKDRAEADAAVASLAAGKTFDELLTERNLKPSDVDLGVVTKEQVADPKIADAAFALAPNTVSAVVDGQFGPAVLRVTAINPKVVKAFDTVKGDLKKEIADARAATEVGETHDAIEDARAGGATLSEVSAKYDLKLLSVPALDASGKDVDGKAVADLPQGLSAAAFQTETGLENDPIQPDRNSYVWYNVTNVTPPRERPLAEVRDRVVAAWKDAERTKQLDAKADAVKQRLDNKETLAAVASSLGLTVKTATKLTRIATPTGDLSAAAQAAAFNGPDGTVAVADGTQPMTRLVLVVDKTDLPPYVDNSPEFAQTKQQLDAQFINSLLGLYLNDLQGKTDVKLNQVALQQALGVTDTTD